jgi:hypothetical protein
MREHQSANLGEMDEREAELPLLNDETKRRVARHVVLFILVNFAIGLVVVSLSGKLVLPVVEMES